MSNVESAGEDLSQTHAENDSSPAVREGLPPKYRMRADSHYVDLLSSRPASGRERMLSALDIEAPPLADASTIRPLIESITRHGVLQPLLIQNRHGKHRLISGHKRLSAAIAAGIADVPCRLYDVDDEEAARLSAAANVSGAAADAPMRPAERHEAVLYADADLEKALASLTACTDFLSGADSELSRTVANTLLRAEVWKASSLLKATRVVREEFATLRTTLSIRKVLDHVANGFAPERRLRLVEFEDKSSVPQDAVMVSDERLLLIALSSAVRATLFVFGEVGATIRMSAAADPGDLMTFTVSQNTVAVPDAWCSRAFDQQWADRPGGRAALISMLAVKQVAEALGGQVRVAPAGRGAAIAISIPAGI
jgi:hypothetical protein